MYSKCDLNRFSGVLQWAPLRSAPTGQLKNHR